MCVLGSSNALGNEARAKRATSATVWQPWEVELTSSLNYTQPKPWWGTELNASFTHMSSGTTLMTPGMATTVTPVLGNARKRAPFTSSIPCSALVHGSVYIGVNDALTCIKDHHTRPPFRARTHARTETHTSEQHILSPAPCVHTVPRLTSIKHHILRVTVHTVGGIRVRAGFWDGGPIWRVRFSPPRAGAWTWTTTCSDASNGGLHGASGSLDAVAYVSSTLVI
jgi:hypothetical protein